MSFHNLPDEVLRNLLFYLDPADTLERFQFIDHRAARLVRDPLLWRYHCFHGFKLWDSSHEIAARTQRPVSEFDWKRLFIQRTAQNAYVAQLFEEILVTRLDRWAKIEEICDLGYDAKEFLIEQCNAPESSEDALARRSVAH